MVRFDGQGVPMIKAETAKLKAKLGTGEKRQQKKEALVGVSYTVDPKPRSPEALAELLVNPEAARARRQQDGTADAPRAQQVRRLASLVRTKQEVMELDQGRRRAPRSPAPPTRGRPLDGALGPWNLATTLFKPWKRVTCVLDIIHVVGSLWSAANAQCGEGSRRASAGYRNKLTTIRRGRVGDVIGGLRQILTKRRLRKSVRETLRKVITCFLNHRRWMPV